MGIEATAFAQFHLALLCFALLCWPGAGGGGPAYRERPSLAGLTTTFRRGRVRIVVLTCTTVALIIVEECHGRLYMTLSLESTESALVAGKILTSCCQLPVCFKRLLGAGKRRVVSIYSESNL